MLEQVVFPHPQDAFASTSDRIDVYGVDLDDSDAESADGEDLDNETERVRRTCALHVATFLATRDRSGVLTLLVSLKPTHRGMLVEELVDAALTGGDTSDAYAVGSLLFSALSADYNEAEYLVAGLRTQLASLEDTMLDVPHAPHLLACMLHATGLAFDDLDSLVKQALEGHAQPLSALLSELQSMRDSSEDSSEGKLLADDTSRRNRFERDSSP